MATKVSVNSRTVVHASSNGIAAGFPDLCKTPTPAGPIPIPYPNIAKSSDTDQGSESITVDGNPIMLEESVFKTSMGNEAGSAGGVVSNTTKGKAKFVNYSLNVSAEGQAVCRMGDLMLQNKGPSSPNTPPSPEIQPPSMVVASSDDLKSDDNEIVSFEIL